MILVTGASGFVGSHLMTALADRALPAIGVSRRPGPGVQPVSSYGAEADWGTLLGGVDVVVHCAARAHVLHETAGDPLAAYRLSNRDASLHLALEASRAGVRRFVFLSSLGVNGSATAKGRPFTAEDPVDPQTDYARSKAEAEAALKALARETGLELVIIRPPLVYGPGVPANFLRLMKLVDRGLPSIFGAVDNKRSYLYVENLCNFIVEATSNPRAAGQTFLVSDDEDLSTARLYRDLARLLGRSTRELAVPETLLKALARMTGTKRPMQQLTGDLQAEISATRRRLGWTPPYSYEEGLAQTVAAYKAARA